MRSSCPGPILMRGFPKLALTDWPMVIPSIFRAGTCFMGFRAWNSSENCGDEALVGWAAWAEPAKAERSKQEAPSLLPTCTSLPAEGPGSKALGDTWGNPCRILKPSGC